MSERTEQFKKTLMQAAIIFVVAVLLGATVNAVRKGGIPVMGNWSAEAKLTTSSGERLIVSFAEAEQMFQNKEAVFLDARSKQEYDTGHIQGAVNLPWHEVEQHFMDVATRISPDRPIITYCDGETCALSKDLALFLKDMGYENVRVLVNGWSNWKKAGLPVDTE